MITKFVLMETSYMRSKLSDLQLSDFTIVIHRQREANTRERRSPRENHI